MKKPQIRRKNRSAGLTIIELLISMAVGSLVLMMLMQMVVMNVAAKRKYEYENYVTNQSLFITDYVRRNLNDLQPHHVLRTETGTTVTITFSHQYDIIYDSAIDGLRQSNAGATSDLLVYDSVAQTLSYDGTLMHAQRIRVLPGTTMTITYFNDTYDPVTCSDYNATRAEQICGDGIVELVLVLAVEFDSGELGEEYTFTTHIII